MPRLASLSIVLLLGACSARVETRRDPLNPPPGTGDVEIDMTGAWVITEREPLHGTPSDDPATPPGPSLTPPTIGTVVAIAGGEFVAGAGRSLLPDAQSAQLGLEVLEYVNRADGRAALYFLGARNAALGLGGVLQIEAGAVDADRMAGEIGFDLALPAGRTTGSWRVTFERAR